MSLSCWLFGSLIDLGIVTQPLAFLQNTAVFCRNANGWVTIPKSIKLPNNQQDRDMIARELLVKFQMSPKHPLVDLKKAYLKF